MSTALQADAKALAAWQDITPLARNNWICWVTIVKKVDTPKEQVERLVTQLKEGVRRHYCWPGSPHRNAKAKKWFGPKKAKAAG
jgi:Bacteriocin-protection, YdeI or OmpD-Associated